MPSSAADSTLQVRRHPVNAALRPAEAEPGMEVVQPIAREEADYRAGRCVEAQMVHHGLNQGGSYMPILPVGMHNHVANIVESGIVGRHERATDHTLICDCHDPEQRGIEDTRGRFAITRSAPSDRLDQSSQFKPGRIPWFDLNRRGQFVGCRAYTF